MKLVSNIGHYRAMTPLWLEHDITAVIHRVKYIMVLKLVEINFIIYVVCKTK